MLYPWRLKGDNFIIGDKLNDVADLLLTGKNLLGVIVAKFESEEVHCCKPMCRSVRFILVKIIVCIYLCIYK